MVIIFGNAIKHFRAENIGKNIDIGMLQKKIIIIQSFERVRTGPFYYDTTHSNSLDWCAGKKIRPFFTPRRRYLKEKLDGVRKEKT